MCIRRKRLKIVYVLLASLLLSSVTFAQNTATPTNDWSALKTVASGSKMVVKLKSGKSLAGKLGRVSDTALSLSVSNKPAELDRDTILTVHQIRGKSAKKAALVGLGTGAAVGAAFGAAGASSGDIFIGKGQAAALFGVFGAGVGALTGFAIGKSGHKRVLIYEAK